MVRCTSSTLRLRGEQSFRAESVLAVLSEKQRKESFEELLKVTDLSLIEKANL